MLIDHLQRVFAERKQKNKSYSLRAFARSLDMDSSTLSAIMSGKRPVTLKIARKIIAGLKIKDPGEAQSMIVETLTGDKESDSYLELEIEAGETIASWEHFAILALLELKTFKHTESHLSERLNISQETVGVALGRLERLGLVQKSRQGWDLTGRNMARTPKNPSRSLREGHRQNIVKALESLDLTPMENRDISGITMAVNKQRLHDARKMIQQFRRRLAKYMEGGTPDSVYRLNVQLFPLSREKGRQ